MSPVDFNGVHSTDLYYINPSLPQPPADMVERQHPKTSSRFPGLSERICEVQP